MFVVSLVAFMQVGKKRNCISMIEDWLYRKNSRAAIVEL